MDADIADLVRQDRLLEAARLSSARGDPRNASLLFERACDWRGAAAEALRAGDGLRGLALALLSRDEAIAFEAMRMVSANPLAVEKAAAHLVEQGREDWAARLFETVGRELDAARAWENAGDLRRAAALFERAEKPAEAARVLEAELRRDPNAGGAAVALGALLVRFGKDEAGLRVLQRVPSTAPERREALRCMLDPLRRLGLAAAARGVVAELRDRFAGPFDPDEAPEPAQAAWFGGRYEVLRQLASSAHARVFEAVDRAGAEPGRERVAIKVFSRGDGSEGSGPFEQLEHDVRALRAIAHPAIVPVRDLCDPGPAVVMAWMACGTLEQMLSESTLAPARSAEIACTVLSALAAAHRMGILHRDIKATNVLFDAAGAAYLSDFGTAHARNASATVTAGDLGVLAYQSPEEREGRASTLRSDLFGVGVLFEQMLTGRRPSHANDGQRPSDVHHGLDERHDRLLASLTARAPEQRPADASRAREWIQSLPWPGAAGHREVGSEIHERTEKDFSREDRLQSEPGGIARDTWTGREIQCVPLSKEVLARARLFAAADDTAVQQVLRVDRAQGRLWLGACRPLGERRLSDGERLRIHDALERLRAAGADPASLHSTDPAGIGIDATGRVVVRF